MIAAADAIIAAEPVLTRTDTIIGDGDHGTGMSRGFTTMKQEISDKQYESPRELFHDCGISLVRSMGGASGVLFGTLLIGGLAEIEGLTTLEGKSLYAYLVGGIRAVIKRGRAKAGDKTMVDALLEAEKQMRSLEVESSGVDEVMRAAATGAREGAEATKKMLPHLGRSKNFREKALGVPDPGALSVSVLFDGIATALEG